MHKLDSGRGWLSTVSVMGASASNACASSGQTTLASGLSYGGDAGAAGLVTGANIFGGTLLYSASYGDDLRLLSSSTKLNPNLGGGTLYQQAQVGYDAASNVTGLDTTLGTGGIRGQTSTDNQSFCYDEQNRLIWASSATAVGPNGCASNTAGTLTGGNALYTASYSYDTLDRLTSGPAGSSYTYGPGMQAGSNPSPLHAALSTSGGYSASYDASGNMLCRAPTSSVRCGGSNPTGAQLAYDNEGRLTSWQNAPSSPSSTDAFAYDGEGSRVAQKAVSNGVSTTTDYLLGGLEEASGSTLTEYYPIPGIGTAVRVSSGGTSTLSYLASDNLGSVTVALSSSGSVTAQQLYSPYGSVRYQSGTMPTAHGYTGQIADAATGLSYYGARYYDPTLGQFTSADTVLDGLNRYAYAHGNPETIADPSGHGGPYPWDSPNSLPRPQVTDSLLQRIVDDAYGHGGVIGPNNSTFDGLRYEAWSGYPAGGVKFRGGQYSEQWHYIKTNQIWNRLVKWKTTNGPTASSADVATADAMQLDATDAGLAALTSPYSAEIPGTPANLASQSPPPPSTGSPGSGPGATPSSPTTGATTGPGNNNPQTVQPQTPATSSAPDDAETELEHLMQVDQTVDMSTIDEEFIVRLNVNPANSNTPDFLVGDDFVGGNPSTAEDNPYNTPAGGQWSGGDLPPIGEGGGGSDTHM